MLIEDAREHRKTRRRRLLNRLPDDCSVKDIQYQFYVLDKVHRGLDDARLNGTVPQEEVQTRLSKWFTK